MRAQTDSEAASSRDDSRVGVLLVNVGTPDAPHPKELARYLREFLMDPFIIDLPFVLRWPLVNLLIVPRRAAYSAEAYEKIWTGRGSPLRFISEDLAAEVSRRLGARYMVRPAMCVGSPSIRSVLEEMRSAGISRIVALPLFLQDTEPPYYSTRELVSRGARRAGIEKPVRIGPPYSRLEGYTRVYGSIIRDVMGKLRADHLLFSFHGVPERFVRRQPAGANYRDQCLETARRLAEELRLPQGTWTASFQSRLGRAVWIGPYTEEVLPGLAQKGIKRLAVACPSFSVDGLETLEEMGIRNRQVFLAAGGEDYALVPCPNASPEWAEIIAHAALELASRA